jgi:methenyltetrahydromethanopterin cyclohydrolase
MRDLQKAMHHYRDDVDVAKIAFESNKKDFEAVMKHVQLEIENSKLDVLRQGETFGVVSLDQTSQTRTMKNINQLKNVLQM